MKRIVLFGAGGLARELAFMIERINRIKPTYALEGFVVDDEYYVPGKVINGYRMIGNRQWLIDHKDEYHCVCAVGEPKPRKEIQDYLEQEGVVFETLISPDVELHETVSIGAGSIICRGCMLTVNINIGKGNLINGRSTIGHDVSISNYACIMGGCSINGYVTIGESAFIGSCACITPHTTIGKSATVAAGSVVFRSVESNRIVLGNPAKWMKEIE